MESYRKALEAYELQKAIDAFDKGTLDALDKDSRYNEPKGKPKASDELIAETIESTEIYRQAKEYILKAAQPEQVGYGLDKYPEPLNADTWTIIETIDHIISESVDKLHYLTMLRIQLLQILGDDSELDPGELKGVNGLIEKFKTNLDKGSTVTLYADDKPIVSFPADSVKVDKHDYNVEEDPSYEENARKIKELRDIITPNMKRDILGSL